MTDTDTEIIEHTFLLEGGFRAAAKRPDGTWDPATQYGVTAPVYGAWLKLGRPATVAELKAMPRAVAGELLQAQYITQPGFTPERVPFEPLRHQLIDFGINSGQARAIRYLQRVIDVPVTSVLDHRTVEWLHQHVGWLRLVNDALVALRVRMIDTLVDRGSMRQADEEGVESRALSFVVTQV